MATQTPTMKTYQIWDLLVANFSRPYPSLIYGADPANQSYTRLRTGFIFRHVQHIARALDHTNATYVPASSVIVKTINAQFDPFPPNDAPTGDVTVADNTFVGGSASLFVGPYELISGRDYVVGAGTAATAANIGAAIDNLPGYSTSLAGSTLTVTGPRGQVGLRFEAEYRGGALNFTFVYTAQEGVLATTLATSPIEPPTILPAGIPNGVAP